MKHLIRVVCAAGCALAAAPAEATVLAERSTAELVARADAIVRARVVAQQVTSPDGRNIVTDSELAVRQVVRGAAPATLVVRRWGGVLGARAMDVHGVAALRPGGEYLLFLVRAGDLWAVAGMAQGAYEIVGDEAIRELHVPLARGGRKGLLPPGAGNRRLALAELIAEIRRVP